MSYTMPDLFQITVKGEAVSKARTELHMRTHSVSTDEPKERGGTDLSATPLETMLSAYLGCTNVITQFVATKMGIKISSLDMSLVGHFDTRGVYNKADVTIPFPLIEMRVQLESDANPEQLASLKQDVARKCPVAVILREAGCKIEDKWTNTFIV